MTPRYATLFAGLLCAFTSHRNVCPANDRVTTPLEISGMVTGFAPDRATGVLYPAEFAGPVYSLDGSTRELVGWYSEQTQIPVVAPGANPLGFIATIGIARFTFEQEGNTVGTITTISLARLVEENGAGCRTDFAKGILCAQADGVVIDGTGRYRNAAGSFTTNSTVNLGLLTLETRLQLTLWARQPSPVLQAGMSAGAKSCCRPAAYVQTAPGPQHAYGRCSGSPCYRAADCGGRHSRSCRWITFPLRCVHR